MGNNAELTRRIIDCISDGYDDEELREDAETELYSELSRLSEESCIYIALSRLCERIEELEA